MSTSNKVTALLIVICIGSSISLFAQSRIKPGIQTTQLADNFYLLFVHNFVNMLVFNGSDGALLVDSGFEPVDLIEVELKKIGIDNIKYIINTHSHGDHVEGNSRLGREAVIISGQRCRDVLLEDDNFPNSGLPNLTFSDSMSIHFNDEEINLYFIPGHTDNDIVIHFTETNIVCIGDFGFFKPDFVWPGTSANIYDMEKSMIWMTKRFSDESLLIHGHTSDYTIADLKSNTEMIQEAIILVIPLIQQNLDLAKIKERNPLKNSAFSMVRENSENWIWNIFRDKRISDKM